MGARNGLHKDGNVLLGAMVEPKKKAIAIITAAVIADHGNPMTQSDLIWLGISRLAQSYGIIDEYGDVTEQFRDTYTLALASVINNNRTNRGTRGGKRSAK